MQINKTDLRINGSLKWGNYPTKIILHHPEFYGDIEDLNELMINDGFCMIGYNYYIRKNGSIWDGRPVAAVGGNCFNQNTSSIGIAFEGNFMKDTMTEEQFQAGVELCKYLMQEYSSIKEVGPHYKYWNTDCPGANFPVNKMIDAIMNNSVKKQYSKELVKAAQHDLQRLGLLGSGEGNATGNVEDKITREAIKQLRYITDLPNGEDIDDNLIRVLNEITKKPTIGTGWSSPISAIKFIQWYIGLPRTGVIDDFMIQKCKKWQVQAGIWSVSGADGVLREKDWNKILK